MKPRLGWIAALCCPFFLGGIFVSIRSHWRPTWVVTDVGANTFRVTANEAGLYVARFPRPRPWSAPRIPQTSNWTGRALFSYTRTPFGNLDSRLLHIPYWPFWLIVTPPIVAWLLDRARRQFKESRVRRNLCVACGYDLRATPTRCPECGHPAPNS